MKAHCLELRRQGERDAQAVKGVLVEMTRAMQVVESFAKALDREDYETAFRALDPRCEYSCRGKDYQGAEQIIASYQGNGDAAQKFDLIEYESSVEPLDDGRFLIHFSDFLRHDGDELHYSCEQLAKVNVHGLICELIHREIPGQLEALTAFKQKHGHVQ